MKAYYTRKLPFGLIAQPDDSVGFDAYPVEVPEKAVETAATLRATMEAMKDIAELSPAPEDSAQAEADQLVEFLGAITNG